MPIIAGTTTAPPPQPPPAFGTPTATWYAPDGTIWPLTDPATGWKTLRDVVGLDTPPYQMTTDPHPRGGARVRHQQPQPRLITWPLLVRGRTSAEIESRWRALEDAITQTVDLGPGVLEVVRPGGGGARRISAHYQEGFEDDLKLPDKRLAVITFYCEDPFWYDPVPVTIYREHGTAVDFLASYPSVSSSQVLGATTLVNPGKVVAWPEWVITGPATQITATLVATGESWTLTPADVGGTLAAGDEVRISTDPPRVRYHPAAGPVEVWTEALDWPSAVLWGLPRGNSDVVFQVDGAAAGTSITLSFHPRYKTS
ncbi:phage tail family protein [Thermomonospora amylolytica]|uniref:phage tail domain-containing protein n=1 Tax=Thermomonospora amylolytica TaxID=1411117 RepID=UPI000E6CFACF|nr:phage tail domain-containing protein [Thermomonospora amylolytica]